MTLPKILKYECTNCKEEKDFIYINSTLIHGRNRIDYYSCSCGETYPLDKLMTLRNISESVTPEER